MKVLASDSRWMAQSRSGRCISSRVKAHDIGRKMFRDLGGKQAFEDPAWFSHSILFRRSCVSPLPSVVLAWYQVVIRCIPLCSNGSSCPKFVQSHGRSIHNLYTSREGSPRHNCLNRKLGDLPLQSQHASVTLIKYVRYSGAKARAIIPECSIYWTSVAELSLLNH